MNPGYSSRGLVTDSNPYRIDARFPLEVLPSSFYWHDDNGANLSLQTLAAEVILAFN